MKQFVRIYRDPATGEVQHVHTQTTPIQFDAIAIEGQTFEREDLELDDEQPEAAEPFMDANTIRGALVSKGKAKLTELDAKKLPGIKIGKHEKR